MSVLSDLLPVLPGSDEGKPVVINTLSEIKSASQGQTVFDLSQVNYRRGYQDLTVVINGITQARSANCYTENSGTRVTLAKGLNSGDEISFVILRMAE